jgi:hypothetical protein
MGEEADVGGEVYFACVSRVLLEIYLAYVLRVLFVLLGGVDTGLLLVGIGEVNGLYRYIRRKLNCGLHR